MALGHSPSIVMDGLVFHIDAANSRSYAGSGLTVNGLAGGIGATLVNGVGFSSVGSGSFIFDGVNDFAIVPSINLSNTDKVTVTAWVRVLNYREVFGSSNLVFEFSPNFNASTGGFVVGFADGSDVFSSTYPVSLSVKGNNGYNLAGYSKTLVNDLNWHHWGCVLDKSISGVEGLFYLDGIQRQVVSTPLSSNNGNNYEINNLYIGNRGDGSNLAGNQLISNFQLYNRALSAQEILQNYNATKGRYI